MRREAAFSACSAHRLRLVPLSAAAFSEAACTSGETRSIILPLAAGWASLWLSADNDARNRTFNQLKATARMTMASVEERLAQNLTHMKAWRTMPMMQEVLINDDGGELAQVLGEIIRKHFAKFWKEQGVDHGSKILSQRERLHASTQTLSLVDHCLVDHCLVDHLEAKLIPRSRFRP